MTHKEDPKYTNSVGSSIDEIKTFLEENYKISPHGKHNSLNKDLPFLVLVEHSSEVIEDRVVDRSSFYKDLSDLSKKHNVVIITATQRKNNG
jgi:hypothetical protein